MAKKTSTTAPVSEETGALVSTDHVEENLTAEPEPEVAAQDQVVDTDEGKPDLNSIVNIYTREDVVVLEGAPRHFYFKGRDYDLQKLRYSQFLRLLSDPHAAHLVRKK